MILNSLFTSCVRVATKFVRPVVRHATYRVANKAAKRLVDTIIINSPEMAIYAKKFLFKTFKVSTQGVMIAKKSVILSGYLMRKSLLATVRFLKLCVERGQQFLRSAVVISRRSLTFARMVWGFITLNAADFILNRPKKPAIAVNLPATTSLVSRLWAFIRMVLEKFWIMGPKPRIAPYRKLVRRFTLLIVLTSIGVYISDIGIMPRLKSIKDD